VLLPELQATKAAARYGNPERACSRRREHRLSPAFRSAHATSLPGRAVSASNTQEFTTRATVTPRRRRRVMPVVALSSPEGALRSSSVRQLNGKRGLPVGKCSHARRDQAAPRGDSAPPCPSLPEPPCSRVQRHNGGRHLRYVASRLSARRRPPLRPFTRRRLRQFRGIGGAPSRQRPTRLRDCANRDCISKGEGVEGTSVRMLCKAWRPRRKEALSGAYERHRFCVAAASVLSSLPRS